MTLKYFKQQVVKKIMFILGLTLGIVLLSSVWVFCSGGVFVNHRLYSTDSMFVRITPGEIEDIPISIQYNKGENTEIDITVEVSSFKRDDNKQLNGTYGVYIEEQKSLSQEMSLSLIDSFFTCF